MKKIITALLLILILAGSASAQKVTFSLANRTIAAGILSYDLIATVPSGQYWAVGSATIRLNISPNPVGSLTILPDNPVLNQNPNISSGAYQPLKTIAASPSIMSFNILTFSTSGFYRFNPGTYTLGKVRFTVASTPFITDSIKFRVNPPFTSALTTVNDSTTALVYPTSFSITNPLITEAGNNLSEIPKEFRLYENYPNPFNPTTSIRYDIASATYVKLTIYDITGKAIETLINENKQPGRYETTFNGSNHSSGIYFARIEAGKYKHNIKMIMIK